MTYEEIVAQMRNAVAGIRYAIYGVEVREHIAVAMENVLEVGQSLVNNAASAEASANAARNSEATVAAHASAARNSEANALAYATAAQASETNATVQANAARNSEAYAASYANIAHTSEANAAASEQNARQYMEEARVYRTGLTIADGKICMICSDENQGGK